MRMFTPHVGKLALVLTIACAGGAGPSPRSTSQQRAIRALSILPAARTACPGDIITARYEATLSDESRVTLGAGDVALLNRGGTAVFARDAGTWQTDADPMASVASGFRLRVSLKTDSTIAADTVVVPAYGCDKRLVDLTAQASNSLDSYVRLGVLRSAFYDSIVVASVEVGNSTARTVVLGPSEMRAGAIRIDARGRAGAPGRAGRNGANGAPCERGTQGDDGEDGAPGSPGGRVDLIVQTDAPWLADLVAISNEGGMGGAAGRGGTGGRAGAGNSRTGSCATGTAPAGRAGRPGPIGAPGPRPMISTVPLPLLWTGSPLWSNDALRAPLEQLIALTQR